MRFLHLADLHLGKQLNDVSFLEDQKYILAQILEIVRDKRIDAVLIAGDVYQKSSPQGEAMEVFDSFVSDLTAMGKSVYLISGNHDSAQRISYFSSLIRSAGVFASEKFEGSLQSYTVRDPYGELVIHLLPFLRPQQVRKCWPGEKIATYEDAVRVVLEHSPIDKKKRNVLLCHQFITGAETSDSEERAVGGLDNIDAHLFDDFDYVALGHIHKPQRVLRDTLRYAGSPLKYSFSEVNHQKSVTVADLGAKGDVTVEKIPLYPLRDMRTVEGMLDDVMAMEPSEDYVWVTVHDELVPPDAKITLTTVFPNMMKMSVVNSKTKTDMDILAKDKMEEKSVEELFCDFYRLQNNDQPPTEAHMKVLSAILKEIEEEGQA